MMSDLRQALRVLLKAPGFSALVVLILAVGIGATSTIFSVVHAVLLRPLPFPESSRLVGVVNSVQGIEDNVSYPDLQDWYTAYADSAASHLMRRSLSPGTQP